MSHNAQAMKLKEVLKKIDRHRPEQPTPANILDPAASTYQIIKQIYNGYKKSNELKILQNKVYTLKLRDCEETACLPPVHGKNTMASIRALLSNSSGKIKLEEVDSLIALKKFLPSPLKKEMIRFVVHEIDKMNELRDVLASFRKVFKTEECLDIAHSTNEDYEGFFYFVQSEMVKKVLSFELQNESDFKEIGKFLLSLPFLKHNPAIVEFIGQLSQRVEFLGDLERIAMVFAEIEKSSREAGPHRYYSKNNDKMTARDFQKICHRVKLKIAPDEGLRELQELLQGEAGAAEFVKMVREEAKSKLKTLLSIQKRAKNYCLVGPNGERVARIVQLDSSDAMVCELPPKSFIADKTRKCVEFVLMALSTCQDLWEDFLSFHSQAHPLVQEYCNQELSQMLSHCSDKHKTLMQWSTSILRLLIRNEDEKPLSQLFLAAIMAHISKQGHAVLLNRTIRKFIALKSMQEHNEGLWATLANPKDENCEFIDVLLECFDFADRVRPFFKALLDNIEKKNKLDVYLSILLETKPKKFREFYQKLDQTAGGEIFEFQQFHLLRYLNEIVVPFPQVAISLVRGMSSYVPSRFCVTLMLGFKKSFEGDELEQFVLSQCLRTLNAILISFPYEQLCTEFKNHLYEFRTNLSYLQIIFRLVPAEMKTKLELYYMAGTHAL